MTLSEAFCDDIAALQAGVFTLLPRRDLSGRHLMYVDLVRLSDVEYDPDSMVSGCLCNLPHNDLLANVLNLT